MSGAKIFITLIFSRLALAANFTQCLLDVQIKYGNDSAIGGVDNLGHPVNASLATALTYDLCVKECGSGTEPFQWSIFSQQFSSWLLPWLALVSQLPYGADDSLENFTAIVLAVGSPVLAAYSLALTVLNGRWINRRMKFYSPHKSEESEKFRLVGRILTNLQQVPITPPKHGNSLYSTDLSFWRALHSQIEYPLTWSNIASSSVAWVLIAYIFTVVDSFAGDIFDSIETSGQGVGSLWLWLLPLVLAWLKISPKSDVGQLRVAIFREEKHVDDLLQSLFEDEQCTAPIHNHTRAFHWTETALTVSATVQSNQHVNTSVRGVGQSGLLSRMIIAALLALSLQWGTTGSAVMVVWFTPTIGLGCRSAAYILFASISTAVWILMTISTSLTHYYRRLIERRNSYREPENWGRLLESESPPPPISHPIRSLLIPSPLPSMWIARLAIGIRRLAKVLAFWNAVWIITSCIFQFTGFFDRCYCNSSVLGLGSNAYNVIILTDRDVSDLRLIWAAAIALAGGSVTVFVSVVWLLVDSPPRY